MGLSRSPDHLVPDAPPRSAEVVVIGGGVIGASVAYHLACVGMQPVLVEARGPASGASGACDGCLFLQTKRPGPHLDFARQSVARLAEIACEFGTDVERERCGGLVLACPGNVDALERHFRAASQQGLPVTWLDGDALRRYEPALGPDVAAAVECPDDGHVNPLLLTRAFALAAQRRGARLAYGETVRAIEADLGRVRGVVTSRGRISAPVVVLAAGAWSAGLARPLGVEAPLRPRRGQIVVTEPAPPLIRRVMVEVGYLAGKYGGGGLAFSAEQTRHGALLLGGTREESGFDARTTSAGIRAILSRAVLFLPRLADVAVVRTFAGLRPATPDGLPVIDALPSPEGLVLACGHEGDGIALAAGTGALVADLVRGRGRTPFPLARFGVLREEPAAPVADRTDPTDRSDRTVAGETVS